MIRIEKPDVPTTFNQKCRNPGRQWLATHPPGTTERFPKYWNAFITELCAGFGNRCGYLAMLDMNGTVDHFKSTHHHRELAYRWSNYRYATGWLNSSKQAVDTQVVDPFSVKDEWFEIDLASLHLRLTSAVPARMRNKAQFTIRRLKLDWGNRVISVRQHYYSSYQNGEFGLDYLETIAPLIAVAVRREQLHTHLVANGSVARADVGVVCGVSKQRGGQLATMWELAGHLVASRQGRSFRYKWI